MCKDLSEIIVDADSWMEIWSKTTDEEMKSLHAKKPDYLKNGETGKEAFARDVIALFNGRQNR